MRQAEHHQRRRPRRTFDISANRPAPVRLLELEEPGDRTLNSRWSYLISPHSQRHHGDRSRLGIALTARGCSPAAVRILTADEELDGVADHHRIPTFRSIQVTPSGTRNFVTVSALSLRPVNQSSCSQSTTYGRRTRPTSNELPNGPVMGLPTTRTRWPARGR